jgi:hypothetical protein
VPLFDTHVPVWLNVELAVLPRKITARIITAAINATMTAYSTAVAPRSLPIRSLVVSAAAKMRIDSIKPIPQLPSSLDQYRQPRRELNPTPGREPWWALLYSAQVTAAVRGWCPFSSWERNPVDA